MSKEYKFTEVIIELLQNPKLEFEAEFVDGSFSAINNHGNIIWKHNKCGIPLTHDTLSAKWTKVQQPVPFMGAVKAHYEDSKDIECHIGNNKIVYKGNDSRLLSIRNGCIGSHEIVRGTWYILD